MIDTYKHKGLRKQLIGKLREKGISDERILNAFEAVPRHYFLDTAFELQAYSDIPFQIGAGQTISHPYTVAFQTQLLNLKPKDKVLEIGTGSGFQTSILCALDVNVFSIERQKELYIKAKEIIQKLGYKPHLFFGDGYKGKKIFAPFDHILVTCGAPFVPQDLIDQLKLGGNLVIPLGEGKVQQMKRYTKLKDGELMEEDFGEFSFVPMLQDKVHSNK